MSFIVKVYRLASGSGKKVRISQKKDERRVQLRKYARTNTNYQIINGRHSCSSRCLHGRVRRVRRVRRFWLPPPRPLRSRGLRPERRDDRLVPVLHLAGAPRGSIDAGDRLYPGMSHRLAHYKYDAGYVFNKHTDGAWPGQSVNAAGDGVETWDAGAESKLSMVLYLSDEDPAGGGQTRLYRFDGGEPVDVAPRKGRALFFRHGFGPRSVPHAGLRLRGKQPKYVCRLNVLYQQDKGAELSLCEA